MSEPYLILVAGMHRSGTSAITHGLEILGVSLGDDLLPANDDNPKGFFEDRKVCEIDDRLLALTDSSWHTLGRRYWPVEGPGELDRLEEEASDLLRERIGSAEAFGLKDPRISRLMPFWLEIASKLGIKTSVVIAHRSPYVIADSLLTRDGFPPEKSLLLWLDYLVSALRSQISPKLVVSYDRLLAQPEEQLERMRTQLSLPGRADSHAIRAYKEEFLTSKLSRSRPVSATVSQTLRETVDGLASALDMLSADEIGSADPRVISALEESSRLLDYSADAIGLADAMEDSVSKLQLFLSRLIWPGGRRVEEST